MSNLENIQVSLNKLNQGIEDKVKEAYELGFNEGMAVKLPTQKEFHKHHQMPQSYGEEGEWILISDQLAESTALKRIRKYLKDECGWAGDELPKELQYYCVGYARFEGEFSYCVGFDAKPTYWRAWGIETV